MKTDDWDLIDKFMKNLKVNILAAFILIFCFFNCACSGDNFSNNTSGNFNIPENSNTNSIPAENLEQNSEILIFEGYPQSRVEAIEAEQKALEEAVQGVDELTYRAFISTQKRWNAGEVISVAFNGGTNELKQKIEEVVKAWSDTANIKFDFKDPLQPNNYREWSTSDTSYKASIRISFDSNDRNGTYWSAIGNESINKSCNGNNRGSCYYPNQASMNLGDFAQRLPNDWRTTVLHEFGHALGFLHEHQSPAGSCEEELRWENDPGYIDTRDMYGQFIRDSQGRRPGVYKVLTGPKNFWSVPQITFNLRKLPPTRDTEFSDFDRNSIMKYHFEGWMYKDISASTNSGCYSPKSVTLSAQDRIAAARAYPSSYGDIQRLKEERLDISNEFLKLKKLPLNLKQEIRKNINSIKEQ